MVFAKKHTGLILTILLSVFAIFPFFNSGFFPIHDDTQIARVYEMGKALKDGMFPVRWVPDLGYGYGYPIFNFYAPLTYYVGGFFNVVGFDALVSTKIMMVIGILLAGVFMYLLSREFWGEIGGIIAGLLYIYAPYHAVDIYVRGDVGEFWAYAFIPLAFLGFYKVFKNFQLNRKVWKWVVVGAIGYAGVILSHNLTAMMVTPFLFIVSLFYCYIAYKNKKYFILNILYLILPAILGILLSAFYWLPALMEMKYTNVLSQIGGGADFRDHFVCIQQLWNSGWGFGGSTRGCIDGMSFKLGKLHILLSVISLVLMSIMILKNKLFAHSHYSVRIIAVLLSLFGLLISLFLMLEVSKPIWEIIPFMVFFQYPWRFLILTSFFTSFLAGSVIWFLQLVIARSPDLIGTTKQSFSNVDCFAIVPPGDLLLRSGARNDGKRIVVSAVVIFLLLFFNNKLFVPQKIINKSSTDYTNDLELRWRVSKISDEYLPKSTKKPSIMYEINQESITSINNPSVKIIEEKTQKIVVEVNPLERAYIRVNIADFPAWKIFVDGIVQTPEVTERGYLLIVDKGKHMVTASYEETPIERQGNFLTLIGALLLVLGIIKRRIGHYG